ncbi:CDP-diacylglycerol--glycerol-3-phosphate 3-phosphatidyltransferase [Saccharomonospora piscinae]|uniref:CDP-diacylglycerol--glycerol-3-phosphate 3-phosphatidyltransferase n=2 Tax=Saccharomonospora piscinae TaxID=687388 RepID=A0A1V9A9L0_SACPI|nr:CDP-alcohol phosphatidyltransferase family protein [Saccharomonospora piscinae]OQO93812.1 CDP-diacylglycerol--glycerol-3-phosphate 3-phosphatidyltransferase [Saccharomonospora piscinae]TLW94973.1 CDP-alcohol phosphatidyltransferase family protein [Saccharomonospora piscinae]
MTEAQPVGTGSQQSVARQLMTVPNLLSIARLAGVPVFLWLLLGPQADGWAFGLLIVSGITDWLDGKLARILDQSTPLGQLLDPAADRLYIAAALLAFLLRDIVPWWVVLALVGREIVVGIALLALRRRRFAPPEVTYIGKAATFTLMYALPLLLVSHAETPVAEVLRPIAYAFTAWGAVLYLWSGALYVAQIARAVGRDVAGRA